MHKIAIVITWGRFHFDVTVCGLDITGDHCSKAFTTILPVSLFSDYGVVFESVIENITL